MNRVKELRKKRGMSQAELAVKARTSPTMLVMIERYGHRPGPDLRERIARALGVTPEDIWPEVRDGQE
jgi:transcriptional regulator with XRE-family HTH domain